eukprot:TRINITY_DN14068_c0_g2_i1.p1 TRINITY_DN14068_c0_g2~~TRINITY_DN14068_c0_g2_i1.p1  ORF type:complete len:375 (-),score=68.80 TRINITY_DN14068_c0_g2_i1:378-1502(-)
MAGAGRLARKRKEPPARSTSQSRGPQRAKSAAGKARSSKAGDDDEKDDFFEAVESDQEGDEEEEEIKLRARLGGVGDGEGENGQLEESADAKRLRMAQAYLRNVRETAARERADREEEEEEDGDRAFDGREEDEDGDGLLGQKLARQQAEGSGRVLRFLASRVIPYEDEAGSSSSSGRPLGRRHRGALTALALSSDDTRAYAASKDGLVVDSDVETGAGGVLAWATPVEKGGHSAGSGRSGGQILSLAVSSDGRYLAGGGTDQRVHVWDARTRQHLQAFKGHRGTVSCLAFRLGSHQLFSGSADRSIKLWSVADGAYMDSLFGHQSELLALDCLWQERVVSAGQDRTCRIWKGRWRKRRSLSCGVMLPPSTAAP